MSKSSNIIIAFGDNSLFLHYIAFYIAQLILKKKMMYNRCEFFLYETFHDFFHNDKTIRICEKTHTELNLSEQKRFFNIHLLEAHVYDIE